ncbi:MAG TPA: RES domain-containing protein [Burkholderiaceae bacterium]|nr:RES domain-containing protein [Burkholderiaceae bacterium]
MQLYRIASSRHPIWDGTGAALLGGRWNSPGRPVIYASMTYAGAMLEVLAHTNIGKVPPSHQCVAANVSDELSTTRYLLEGLPPGWDLEDSAGARKIGDAWLDACKTALLIVPSVVARLEWNVLVNPRHSDAIRIRVSDPEVVRWDQRLFSK